MLLLSVFWLILQGHKHRPLFEHVVPEQSKHKLKERAETTQLRGKSDDRTSEPTGRSRFRLQSSRRGDNRHKPHELQPIHPNENISPKKKKESFFFPIFYLLMDIIIISIWHTACLNMVVVYCKCVYQTTVLNYGHVPLNWNHFSGARMRTETSSPSAWFSTAAVFTLTSNTKFWYFDLNWFFFAHCSQRSIAYLAMLKTWPSAPSHYLTFRLNEPAHFKGGFSWNSMNLFCILREAGSGRFMRDSLAACNFHVNKISCVLEEDVTFKLLLFFFPLQSFFFVPVSDVSHA